jgi:GT2 family glycosyltransferase
MADLEQDKILMVIPSLSGEKLLARMLPTLRFKRSNVIVLDQGSTDETARVCAECGVEMVQLGHPHTYTEACNLGAQIARQRGSEFLCVSNNDITFRTNVLSELLAEMQRDPRLGIVAPSQVVVNERDGLRELSWRVSWNLDKVEFLHDTNSAHGASERLEADFCELTCALVRMSAVDQIEFLDDHYGFYHEDADFGFRLRQAGYNCAYLPKSQIEHFSGSTFSHDASNRKASYIARNKLYFATKHLGFYVNDISAGMKSNDPSNALNRNVHRYIKNYGLINSPAPELVMSNPGRESSGYLYTDFEAATIPAHWANYTQNYRALFATSEFMRDVFAGNGFGNCFHVPIGVESDIFHPWGPTRRICDAKTYLAFADGRQKQSLRVVLEAWHQFTKRGRNARLILFGEHLRDCTGRPPDTVVRSWGYENARYYEEMIDVYDVLLPFTEHDLAQLYRAVDYTIPAFRGAGSTLAALQSIACGVPCIFSSHGQIAELAIEGGLELAGDLPGRDHGRVMPAGAAHPAMAVVQMVGRLEESYQLSDHDRATLGHRGIYRIRAQSTLRHTAMALREALTHLQAQDPRAALLRLGPMAVDSPKIWHRLSRLTARRVKTVGVLATQFGTVWEERGFSSASRAASVRLRRFVARRLARVSLVSDHMLKPIRAKAIKPFARKPALLQRSALLIGYIDAQLGLGESLRGLALAMAGSSARFSIYPFGFGVEGRRLTPFMAERYDLVNCHAVNVIEVAGDELATVFRHVSECHFDRSYNVLRTYWELSKAPESWRPHLRNIDEIWAPSTFVAESFRTIFDGPITMVPPCIKLPDLELDGHSHFGLDVDRFYFLFSFDYFSFPQRKNPLAVVRAFSDAFLDLSSRVGLIIKSSGKIGHYPHIKEALQASAQDDNRIEIIDKTLSRQEMLALLAAANCYVSLHRSEGFGLGMAEAMALGKPVIATDYSGNTDFLSEATGYPLPYRIRNVAPDEYVHTDGQVWAEPDEAACSAAMTHVFADPEGAAARGRSAQRFIEKQFGTRHVGRIVENRLNEIFELSSTSLPPDRKPSS